jgi:hypothetical protein
MTRIINGVAYASDYEEIVGVEAGSGQHPVVRKVVTPGDVNFSTDQPQPSHRRRADTGAVPVQPANSEQAPNQDGGR